MRFPCLPACALLAAALLAPARAAGGELKQNVILWLGNPFLGVFDEQLARYLAAHAEIVICRTPQADEAAGISFAEVIRRIHRANPAVKVLLYAKYGKISPESRNLENDILDGIEDLGDLILLRDQRGRVIGDLRAEGYRSWLAGRVAAMVQSTGADGVAFDAFHRRPNELKPGFLAGWAKKNPDGAGEFALGVDAFCRQLGERLGPDKIVFFNGLWNVEGAATLENQLELLKYTGGAQIEYFGMPGVDAGEHGRIPDSRFEAHILPLIEAIRDHPEARIMACGRSPWEYIGYGEDYFWQRYLYGAYLLGASPASTFKYAGTFQVPTVGGRASGLDLYADHFLDPGPPLGPFERRNGVYLRRFGKGLVLVLPEDQAEKRFTLDRPWYTPEGQRVSGEITLKPASAVILTEAPGQRRPWRATLDNSFDGPNPAAASWPNASVQSGGEGGRYLSLRAMPAGREWEHDLLLSEPIRRLENPVELEMKIRTADPGARLLFQAEVDDAEGELHWIVLEASARAQPGAATAVRKGRGLAYRSPRAAGETGYLGPATPLQADGAWHTLRLGAGHVFKASSGRFTLRQWNFVRLTGNLDIDSVEIR